MKKASTYLRQRPAGMGLTGSSREQMIKIIREAEGELVKDYDRATPETFQQVQGARQFAKAMREALDKVPAN